MKRFVTLCVILLLSSMAGAQSIPDEFIGEFMGQLGQVEVEAMLVDYQSPYSIPDSTMTHILFGKADFVDDVASLTFTSIAKRICASPVICFAVNPTPILLTAGAAWSPEHNTYIWMQDHPFSPMFSVIAVDTSMGQATATFATGTFYLEGSEWLIHPYATYTNYFVTKRHTMIVPYMPYAQLMEVF